MPGDQFSDKNLRLRRTVVRLTVRKLVPPLQATEKNLGDRNDKARQRGDAGEVFIG